MAADVAAELAEFATETGASNVPACTFDTVPTAQTAAHPARIFLKSIRCIQLPEPAFKLCF
ncbi:protein of unknown function [Paraburkholderia kururiensis]